MTIINTIFKTVACLLVWSCASVPYAGHGLHNNMHVVFRRSCPFTHQGTETKGGKRESIRPVGREKGNARDRDYSVVTGRWRSEVSAATG